MKDLRCTEQNLSILTSLPTRNNRACVETAMDLNSTQLTSNSIVTSASAWAAKSNNTPAYSLSLASGSLRTTNACLTLASFMCMLWHHTTMKPHFTPCISPSASPRLKSVGTICMSSKLASLQLHCSDWQSLFSCLASGVQKWLQPAESSADM